MRCNKVGAVPKLVVSRAARRATPCFRSSVSKPLGEPAIDRSEKIARLIPFALIAPEPRHAHRYTQFPGLCRLLTRNRERTLEIRLSLCRIRLGRLERDFPGNAIDLGIPDPGGSVRGARGPSKPARLADGAARPSRTHEGSGAGRSGDRAGVFPCPVGCGSAQAGGGAGISTRPEEVEKRSRQRVRDQPAHMAFGAETRMRSSARISMTLNKDRQRPRLA